MQAEIISIGDEIMSGASTDTNSAWLSARLTDLGVSVRRHVTVGDDRAAIASAFREAAGRAELVVVTGGLGPTADDLTRQSLADVADVPLELDEASLGAIERFFADIGRPMPESNRAQAMFPRGAAPLANRWGTAPGIRLVVGACTVFAMPGVPREMFAMFDAEVAPFVRAQTTNSAIALCALRCFGAGESTIAEHLGEMMTPGRNPAVGTTASEGVITVRIRAHAASQAEADQLANRDASAVRTILGKLVFGEGDDTLESVIGALLYERRLTLSTAESCTGGLLGSLVTNVPGSSAYYLGGYVTYSDETKSDSLGVDPALLASHGAVSKEAAAAMATGCKAKTGSDFALSITGVAGPGGGTPDKPVGLVYAGLAGPHANAVRECRFSDRLDRLAIRGRAARTALNMLRLELVRGHT